MFKFYIDKYGIEELTYYFSESSHFRALFSALSLIDEDDQIMFPYDDDELEEWYEEMG